MNVLAWLAIGFGVLVFLLLASRAAYDAAEWEGVLTVWIVLLAICGLFWGLSVVST